MEASAIRHGEAEALFAPMVDHELGPVEEAALRSHLSACPECQRGFEKYSRAVALVRSIGTERAPADFTHLVLKRLRRRRRGILGLPALFEGVSVPVQIAIVPVLLAAVAAAALFLLGR